MDNNILTEKTPFLETIYRLRNNEEIVIFEKQFATTATEEKEVIFFLETEYEKESVDYPFDSPVFDGAAALWSAKLVYFGAQLLLFREETAKDIPALFPEYNNRRSDAADLSADICLRFLPHLAKKLKEIDPGDPLIERVELLLHGFPYSAIGYFGEAAQLQFDDFFMSNDCCRQLLINRILEKKDRYAALEQTIKPLIESALGNHQGIFWPGLNL
ncbi:MAG: hypothetical protein QM687_00325 [Ferruginibacter sp.]